MKTQKLITLLIVLKLVFCASASRAATITATGGGNWHSASTWIGGVVPSASDDAIITPAVYLDSAVSIHNLTISGSGGIYVGSDLNVSGDLAFSGTATMQGAGGVAVIVGGNLNIGSGTSVDISGANLTVTGSTTISGTLQDLWGGNGSTSFGDVTVASGGVWRLTDVMEWSVAGNLVNNGSMTANNATSGGITFTGSGKTITGNATAIPNLTANGSVGSQVALTVGGTLAGNGTLTVAASSTLTLGGTVTVGTLDASASPNTVTYSGAAQTVKPAAYNQLTLSGSNVKTFSSGSTVSGDLTISSPVRAAINTTVTVTGTTTVNAGATLSGTGTLNGATVVNGTIAPGPTIGTLTLGSSPSLNGTTVMEINRTASPNADLLTISGNPLACGGTLTVNNIGSALVAGNTFQLFNASGYSGAFGTVTLPTLGANLAWNNTLTSNGAISVISTLAPGTPKISFSSSGTNLTLSWDSTTFPGYSVQAQTNSVGAGLGNSWSDTGSGTVSPYQTTIDPANPTVFYRLAHP